MTDKSVMLDYAQELQTNDEPWREFEYSSINTIGWVMCSERLNPLTLRGSAMAAFRRKPKTITITMPVPVWSETATAMESKAIYLRFKTETDRDTALAAIRDAMGGGE